jgi:hypothetical protein
MDARREDTQDRVVLPGDYDQFVFRRDLNREFDEEPVLGGFRGGYVVPERKLDFFTILPAHLS